MNKTKLSGPVFPTEVWDAKGFPRQAEGMYLRDYFAAKALQGMLAENGGGALRNDKLAAYAYNIADEMLKARDA
jgi:hypothetical protein